MMGTRARVLAALLLAALATLAAAPGRARAQEKVTTLLATGIQIGHVREFVARQLFYPEEGLDVTLQPAQGSAQQLQYMTAGKGTLGSIDMHMLLELRKKGVKLVSPYAHFQKGVYRIGVLEGGPVKTLADLKGKPVGVPTRSSGAFPFLLAAAREAGVREADMEIIPVTFGPAATQALVQRRIVAIATTSGGYNNIRYLGEQSKDWKLHEMKVPMNAWPTNALVVTEDEARHKRKMVIGLLRGFAKAHVFVMASPLAALEVTQKLYPELVTDKDKPRLAQILQWGIEDSWMSERGRDKPLGWFDPEAWAGTERYYKAEGMIDTNQSLREIIDESFIAEVNNFDKDRIRTMALEMARRAR
jgi:NitT/TauT family transport system substrate-binding protein